MDLKVGIVRILKPDGRTAGSGFVVSEKGLITTCSHVVQDERSQRRGDPRPEYVDLVFLATGDHCRARVEPDWWRGADAEDVAILRLEGELPAEVTPLPLGTSVESKGRTFRTFGFCASKDKEGLPGKGEIIGETTEKDFPVLSLRSNEITAGFSGAPVWDKDLGVVIGMVTSILSQDRYGKQAETAFITPIETLRAVCPALRLPAGEPYRGLQVFEAEHAGLYFGREAATEELLGALARHDAMLLEGVSGSGKSSLVRAGLEKGLRECSAPGLTDLVRCLAVPGRHPLFNLALALVDLPDLGPGAVAQAFELPPEALTQEGESRRRAAEDLDRRAPQALAAALSGLAPPPGLLIIVDQLERLYTECPDKAVQDRFIEALLAALEAELAEVQRKIELTDDLIDQIVYRLYGLTEEEIAIVEGKT